MNQTVTLVIFVGGFGPGPNHDAANRLTDSERRALVTFEAREKVTLAPAVAEKPTPRPAQADIENVAMRIEEKLEEAQTLAASLDEERALVLLEEIERELLAHAELPQAAWLMAERHQLTAAVRKGQPGGASEAARLLASARVLEGSRAASFGEAAAGSEPAATPVSLRIGDLDATDELVLDGRPATPQKNVLPGRHHVRVKRGNRLVWSGWIDVAASASVETVLGVPPRVACSRDDLADVEAGTRTPSVPRGVRCARWIGVRRGTTGLEVAWCEGARCTAYGPLLAEQKSEPGAASLPPWVAATIVGAATIGAASLLVVTGAFDRERPPPVSVTVYRGPP